jgi:hypothetical protein
VGEVAAVGQAHAQHGVAGIQQRQKDGAVGLGAGVRLHVGVVGAEQLLGAVNGQLLDIDVFAAAVIALARIAFGVLVGELGALGLHHGGRAVVFRGDELDMLFLASVFLGHGTGQIRVKTGKCHVFAEHHEPRWA